MYSQYAGVGVQCPPFDVSVQPGGNISSSGTIYLSFQLQNRAGYNIPSVSDAITYAPGDKIQITIPESARSPAWDIFYFIISCGNSADASTHVQLARYPNYSYGAVEPQTAFSPLPFTLELTEDEHLALAPNVTTAANLPTGINRLDGQIRWVIDQAKFFEYRADSTLAINPDVIAADVGQWVRVGAASTYVSDTRNGQGSDRPIVQIDPTTVIPTPDYAADKSLPGWSAKYWLYNDDDQALKAGTEFGIELEYLGVQSPDLLSGLFMIAFLGYAQTDGTLRTEDSDGNLFDVGAFYPWTPRVITPFITPDDLQPDEAIAIAVKPFFSVADFNQGIAPGSSISVLPVTRSQSGDYSPLGKLLPGGAVYAAADFYRVVPNTGLSYFVLSGHAIVDSYDFPIQPKRIFGGLQPNTADQRIVINGNASVFTELSTYSPPSSEAIRAIVGTVAGESSIGEWSEPFTINSGVGLRVTVTYPTAIRGDYPDVIADSTKGAFNAFGVNIYMQRLDTEEIRRFSGFLTIPATTQEFNISDWGTGIGVNLPVADASFSLFSLDEFLTASNGSGSFPSGVQFRVALSLVYDGNQVTSISHASPPCIKELPNNFEDILNSTLYIELQEDSFINALIFG